MADGPGVEGFEGTKLMTNRPAVPRTWIRGCFLATLTLGVALEGGSCGGGGQTVRDDTSPEQHRAEAQREEAATIAHAGQGKPNTAIHEHSPVDRHSAEVEKHKTHARQHEATAAKLGHFEQAECKDVPPSTRVTCPLLGPAEDIRDIEGGVVIRFAPSIRADAVVAQMKCHLAYARAQGYRDAPSCPLYVAGLSVRLGAAPSTVEITVSERERVGELRRSAHEEVAIETRPPRSL